MITGWPAASASAMRRGSLRRLLTLGTTPSILDPQVVLKAGLAAALVELQHRVLEAADRVGRNPAGQLLRAAVQTASETKQRRRHDRLGAGLLRRLHPGVGLGVDRVLTRQEAP